MKLFNSFNKEQLDLFHKIINANFKFAIYENLECTKLIKEIESEKESGTVFFEELKYGTYYIKEIQAPNGYLLSDKIMKLEINDSGTFVDGVLLEDINSICEFDYYLNYCGGFSNGNSW